MIPIFAWRNMWRNKSRSLVIIAAFIIGIFAGIFIISFLNGMINSRINAVISTELSHIQIHQPGFLDNNEFSLRFNSDSTIEKLKNIPHIIAVSKRIIVNAMVASAETGTGIKITGIDPDTEKTVSSLHSKIIKGTYFSEKVKNPVIISEKLARKLKVNVHQKVIITLQDKNENITGGAFRIAGIFETDNQMFDEANIFVRNKDLALLTDIPSDEAHEIAIIIDRNDNTELVTQTLKKIFPDYEVKNWLQLSPDAGALVGVMNQYAFIFTAIILMALCFAIVNTMLMVIMERIHELGMLMAIGMSRAKVFAMIMLETILLSITGGIIGLAAGWAVSAYLEKNGVNLYFWKEAFGELGYSTFIYPVIEPATIFITAMMVILAGIFSSLYPAIKAIRLIPAQAIRES